MKMKLKRIFILLLAACLCLTTLAGCGESFAQENVVIIDFDCDPMDVLIGEETTVTFTADIYSSIDLGPEDVYVVDEDDNLIGYMNDEGTGGDETAKDGIYTYQYTCRRDEEDSMNCYAVAGDVKSEKAELSFYRNYTSEEFEQAKEVAGELSASIQSYLTENYTVLDSDIDSAMEEITGVLDGLKQTGVISDYEAGRCCFEIITSTGFPFLYSIEMDGYDAGGSGGEIITFEPYVGSYASSLYNAYSLGEGTKVNLNERQIEATDGSAEKIADTFSDYNFSDAANYDVENVTLDSLKNLGNYSVILWAGHGGYWGNVGSMIGTGEEVDENEPPKYCDDIKEHRVYSKFDAADKVTYAVTGGFFKKYLDDDALSGSLIYLGACESGIDMLNNVNDEYPLVQTLLDKGASAVFANSDDIKCLYNYAMMTDILSYMCETNANGSRYHTAAEALRYAQEKNGDKDPYNPDEGHEKAEVLLFSNTKDGGDYHFDGNGELQFQIVDPSGEPYHGSDVVLYIKYENSENKLMLSCRVDSSGQYHIELPEGKYRLEIQADQISIGGTKKITVKPGQITQCTYYMAEEDVKIVSLKDELFGEENDSAEETQKRALKSKTVWYSDLTSTKSFYSNDGKFQGTNVYDSNGDMTAWTEYMYDNNGILLSDTTFDSNGEVSTKTDYVYDDDKNMVTGTTYDLNGVITEVNEYTYDGEGRTTSSVQTTYNENGEPSYRNAYTYDSEERKLSYLYDGRLDSSGNVEDYTRSFKKVYNYDSDGHTVTYTYYNSDGSISSQDVYAFDTENKELTRKHYDSDGKASSWDEYKYDADGGLYAVEHHYMSEDGSGERSYVSEYRSEYTYDSSGNVLTHATIWVDDDKDAFDEDIYYLEEFTYDIDGNVQSYKKTEDEKYIDEYTFNGNGDILTYTYTEYKNNGDLVRCEVYEYYD